MELPFFRIIVATDDVGGIGKNGSIPWNDVKDKRQFMRKTIGNGNNAVIMGRKTFDSIGKPLPNRVNIVITSRPIEEDVVTVKSFLDALIFCGKKFDNVWVIGGSRVYQTAIFEFGYLCAEIDRTSIPGNFGCDVFFPMNAPKVPTKHDEQQYLDLLRELLNAPETTDRTGTGTKSMFGCRMEFDISQCLPVITTKKLFLKGVIAELLFFLRGETDTKKLEAQGVNIWKQNTSREFLEKRGLPWQAGDMGPSYGHQWRNWGEPYIGCDEMYEGIDQIHNLIEGLKKDPTSRRHILCSWNVSDIDKMALPCCHILAQFYSRDGWLSCQMYQRSADMFLGVPFNITSYCLLTYIIGHLTGLKPRRLIIVLGDAHIYCNHIEQVKTQIERTAFPFPTVRIVGDPQTIEDFTSDSIVVENYNSWPPIKAEMAV